jgi:hypothetical protein
VRHYRRVLEQIAVRVEIGADENKSAADELLGHLHKKPAAPRNKKPDR